MKHSAKCLLLAVVTIALPCGLMSSARAELVGYWPFDEVVEVDGELTTPDISPDGGHHGVLSDTAEFTENGLYGGAIDFGEFANKAIVRMPSFPQDDRTDAGVDPSKGPGWAAILESQEATISLWQNRGEVAATNQITFSFDDGGNRQMRSHAPWSNGQIYYDVAGCCGGNQRINTSMNGADTDGEWHHLAYVKKKNEAESDKAITVIFQDGVPLVSSPGCDLACWADGAGDDLVDWGAATIDDVVPITLAAIGDDPSTGTESQDGRIDDFAIWNEALSTERIVALANGASPNPLCEGCTLGDFNMDGAIDSADFTILAENFNGRYSVDDAFSNGDMDGNLRTNLKDFNKFRDLFLNPPVGAVASAVPEPGTSLLLGIAAFSLFAWRRRFS